MNSNIHLGATSTLAALSLLIPDQERTSTGVIEMPMAHNLQTSFHHAETHSIESGGVKVASPSTILIPPPDKKWGTRQMPHFMSLLRKHSLAQATEAEEAELEHLQRLKSLAEDRRTSDELLLEWKFRQKVDQILKLLQQTAIHGAEQTNPPNSPWFST
jgi:hypothetical protein